MSDLAKRRATFGLCKTTKHARNKRVRVPLIICSTRDSARPFVCGAKGRRHRDRPQTLEQPDTNAPRAQTPRASSPSRRAKRRWARAVDKRACDESCKEAET